LAATEQLELSDAQAKKIVKLAIENGAYSDDMPEDKKGRIEAARESVDFCIDSWVNDGVRPDDDDEDIAAAGEAIASIFEAAGIEIDEDGNLITPEAEDDDDDEPTADDDEEAFNPDDYIEGWSELSSASKIKALKELDLDDEDTLGIVNSLKEWEEENEPKGFAKVLSWIEENTEASSDDDDDDDDNDDDDDDEPEAEAMEEPWKGYDKATAVDIKKVLDETDDLEVEQVEYVKEYEEARDKPRKRVLDKCDELIEALSKDDSDDDDDDEPVTRRGSGTGKNVGKLALGKAKAAKAAPSNGSIMLTREMILTALDSGEVEIEL
jgi:hypothetical protein